MRWHLLLSCTLLLVLSVSCSDRPDGVPKSKEMVEVLLDYHIADAMAMQKGDNTAFTQQIYTDAALKKHGLTRDQFHQALQYYERHNTKLLAIYQHVDMRLAEMVPGANGGEIQSDSANNIWNGRSSYILSANNTNRLSFEMVPPRSLKPLSTLEWTFNVQWMYREGNRTADVLLVLVYEGDSVVTHHQQLFGSGKQKISTNIGDKPLKLIKGLIYQDAFWSAKPKIMYLSQMGLYVRDYSRPNQPIETPVERESHSLRTHRDSNAVSDSGKTSVPSSVPRNVPNTAPDFVSPSGNVSKSEQDVLKLVEKNEGKDQPHFK